MSDKDNAVQQAQGWAQEARTQRATVLSILRFFGLPEHDYEALTLIQQKIEAVASEWDECHYDAPGGEIEIGPALRRALAAGVDTSDEMRHKLIEDAITKATGAHRVLNAYDYEDVFACCEAALTAGVAVVDDETKRRQDPAPNND